MSDKDYKQDIVINASALETEWLRQPGLYLKYAELLADARRQAKKAAERVKVCRSELVERAQGNPQGCLNSEKATSQLIEAYYRTHKDHKEAKTKLVDAEYEADIYDAAVLLFIKGKRRWRILLGCIWPVTILNQRPMLTARMSRPKHLTRPRQNKKRV